MKHFKLVAYLEGISFLVLLFIAMPLKYMAGLPLAVRVVGSLHGLLFVVYVGMLAMAKSEWGWSAKKTALAFIAAVLPFGTFVFEKRESYSAEVV